MRPFRVVRLAIALTVVTVAAVRRHFQAQNAPAQPTVASPQR